MLYSLLPVIIFIVLGYVLTKIGFLDDAFASNLKKLVVNVTLPAGLIASFAGIRFELKYLIIFVSMFIACAILLRIGRLIAKIFKIENKYFPLMMTGFEAGMLGYALFAAAYGTDNYSTFGIIDVGHVLFVFIVLVPIIISLNGAKEEKSGLKTSLQVALKSPVIWAIVGGLILSICGIWRFEDSDVYIAVESILNTISSPTSFLICLVIGNGIKLSFKGMKLELLTNGVRLLFALIFAVIINFAVIKPLGMDAIYTKAVFVMFVLPAPFAISVFMENPSDADKAYVANTLSIGTMLALVGFLIITTLL